jgi:hypothetical protein
MVGRDSQEMLLSFFSVSTLTDQRNAVNAQVPCKFAPTNEDTLLWLVRAVINGFGVLTVVIVVLGEVAAFQHTGWSATAWILVREIICRDICRPNQLIGRGNGQQ